MNTFANTEICSNTAEVAFAFNLVNNTNLHKTSVNLIWPQQSYNLKKGNLSLTGDKFNTVDLECFTIINNR